jgi:hypothetical protein
MDNSPYSREMSLYDAITSRNEQAVRNKLLIIDRGFIKLALERIIWYRNLEEIKWVFDRGLATVHDTIIIPGGTPETLIHCVIYAMDDEENWPRVSQLEQTLLYLIHAGCVVNTAHLVLALSGTSYMPDTVISCLLMAGATVFEQQCRHMSWKRLCQYHARRNQCVRSVTTLLGVIKGRKHLLHKDTTKLIVKEVWRLRYCQEWTVTALP